MTHEPKAVVLVSGGIDSATCLAHAAQMHQEVVPIFIDYGQQTVTVEEKMARAQCFNISERYSDVFMPETPIVNYEPVFRHFAEGVAAEDKDFDHMEEEDGRSSGYVPMRNLHLIATAAAKADVSGAGHVYHGAQMGDDSDYPDCRPEFMDAAAAAINRSVPNGQSIELETPLLHLSKTEVIQKGAEAGVDFAATYSCYSSVENPDDPTPCGECPACVERAEAFEMAGIEDPHGTEVSA